MIKKRVERLFSRLKKEGKNILWGWVGYWGENPFGVVDRILAILNRKIEKDEKTQEYNFSRNINS